MLGLNEKKKKKRIRQGSSFRAHGSEGEIRTKKSLVGLISFFFIFFCFLVSKVSFLLLAFALYIALNLTCYFVGVSLISQSTLKRCFALFEMSRLDCN